MLTPILPKDESARVRSLHSLKILDTVPEERFDRVTRMAKRLFDVPISLVSLVDSDRQWFKSAQGLDANETPRDISFCGHAILQNEVFCVTDALKDKRFFDNPLVTGGPKIRFYAASPLKTADGRNIGTLCLIDDKPRLMTTEDVQLLRDLAAMVEHELCAMQLATMDELTQISNRRGFNLLTDYALHQCDRLSLSVTLLHFDLNQFKPINDTYGHAEGDRALAGFAGVLSQVFRDSDVVARLGGDEFAVLLTGTSENTTALVLERLAAAVAEYNFSANRGYEVTYSVGQADWHTGETMEALLARADMAMYKRKAAMRNEALRMRCSA